ncbi:MAG: MucR family transcriptional regulator [Hyphomonadaceae bacterium]|nr:MucR family transcriptional regulator [Hyphomonadaceae bacterium]
MEDTRDIVRMTAQIAAAYVSANTIPQQDIPALIRTVHATLRDLAGAPHAAPDQAPAPAVSIKKSVTADHIICLEDGKKFKSLKRHLRTRYGMTPDEYRAKWGLPHDYPMVAPNYARERSTLAKRMGLGQTRRGE